VPPGCGPAPAAPCRAPVASNVGTLAATDAASDAKDRLAWSWAKGAATTVAEFGDPTTATSYRLCMYDQHGGVPALVMSTAIAAGGACAGHPCWRASRTGFRYKDPDAAAEGVRQLVLKAGGAGRSKIQVRAQGPKLALPDLPFAQDPALTVQLRSSDGGCWGAAYSAPARHNDGGQFKDRAD